MTTRWPCRHRRSATKTRRRGAILIFFAITFVCLVGFLALAVDVGYLYNVKSDLQAAADAAALAGAGGLGISQDEAIDRAIDIASKNFANGAPVQLLDSGETHDIEVGYWGASGFRAIDPSTERANAVRVTAKLTSDRGNGVALFLAPVLGVNSANVTTQAVAVFGSREIVLAMDLSASMSYDSQLRHIPRLGEGEVRGYLTQIWNTLYGDTESPLADLAGTDLADDEHVLTSTSDNDLIDSLGLTGITYPFPPHNWSDYFDYVQQADMDPSDRNPRNENKAVPPAYKNHYGYLTFMDYLQAVQYRESDHVPLWKTSQQPIKAVKDAIGLFMLYMDAVRTDDRVALVTYTGPNDKAKLDVSLTADYEDIEDTMNHRQAGHYHNETNIAGGIEAAREELLKRGREGTSKLIVLLSDGQATLTLGGARDPGQARLDALAQADECAKSRIPILTISLGSAADTDLMDQIARKTEGVHFVIPGGRDVNDYKEKLNDVFKQIAARRPLRLVY